MTLMRTPPDIGYDCPACKERTPCGRFLVDGGDYTGCLKCGRFWESLPDGEPMYRDDELMPFAEMCSNCAFRAGSPESQDKPEWKALLKRLRAGGLFFCHKAVPIAVEPMVTLDQDLDIVKAFDFPLVDGKPDPNQMRTCRGFLNAWSRWQRQSR